MNVSLMSSCFPIKANKRHTHWYDRSNLQAVKMFLICALSSYGFLWNSRNIIR